MTTTPFRAPALRLTVPQFAGVAAGYGDPGTIAVLTAGQLSRRRLLIRAVADQARARGLGERAGIEAALRLLATAERRAPAAATAVIGHPYVAVWAQRCLRLLTRSAPDGADLPHLTSIAAAAAARAGVQFTLTVPARDGAVGLPTLGTAHGLGKGPVRVQGADEALIFTGPAARVRVPAPLAVEVPGWAPRRDVPLDGFSLAIEDVDFYRDCYPWRPRGRLSTEDARRLGDLLGEAWQLIVADHPAHAQAMRDALRSVVPVNPAKAGGMVSAAARSSYGSVATSIPADPAAMALLLIHEFQHMKLGGLLDLVPLHHSDGTARHCAPWRADPRPAEALLQGTYAHLGVADFWRRHRHRATGRQRRLAEFEFGYWRAQSARAARTLGESGELTVEGAEFVGGLSETLRRWADEPTDGAVRHGVPELIAAATVRWRLTNLRPTDAETDRLHAAWSRRVDPVADPRASDVTGGATAGPAVATGLAALIRQRMIDPGAGRPDTEPDPADAAYLAGEFAKATEGYAERIARDPGDDDAWVGLALAMAAAAHAGAGAMSTMPATVRALYARIRQTGPPAPAPTPQPGAAQGAGPVEVAGWLASGLTADA
ncbi:HEXXH motif domain-containing protein [Micromonospora sp. NPDC049679]|uniref:HEXXH motif domain-containing protein n=1 Tax=Micromonospora sp. NPDC049679 TaxID=3155920 RepID=UPI0033EDF609